MSSSQPQPEVVDVDLGFIRDGGASSADSSYESELGSYTTSLASKVSDYHFKNGRRYQAYKEESYIYPNDEAEQERLDVLHQMIHLSMNGKLHFAPLKAPKHILDIGTGTGLWAMEIADKYPDADVLGNDLSPIQPRWVPPNVHFEIDDVENAWTYSHKFDYIHCRSMSAAIRDWPKLVKQAFNNLKPGGYAEFVDFEDLYTSPDGSLKPDSDIASLNQLFIDTATKNGIDPGPGPRLAGWLKDAGYQDVTAEKRVLPIGTWPADKHLKEVGAWNFLMLNEGIEGIVNYLFGEHLGMSKEELTVVCAKVRKQLKDPKVHCMYYVHIVYGRKPETEQRETEN